MNTESPSPIALRVRGLDVDLATGAGATRPLLQDIGFTLRRRAVLGVLGESGSGKSVLARALCNALDAPLSARGHVGFDGRNLLALSRAAMSGREGLWGRRIAYIGADPTRHFDPTQPVGAQLVEKLRAVEPDVSRADATARVLALLDDVRIPEARARFHDLPRLYSGGMIQRAAIADALITDPKVLIADSITQPLDTTVAAQVLRLLRALRTRFQTTIVFASASPAVIGELADDVLVLHAGRAVEQGPAWRILQSPTHPVTRRLIADVARVWTGHGPPAIAAASAPQAPLLQVDAVHKSYARTASKRASASETVHAVRGVSLDVRRGERLGIVGESGCGKSTLTRLLSGLERPDAGRIRFDGVDTATLSAADRKALRRRLQLVLPDPYQALPAHWPIGRTVAESLRIQGRRDDRGERETVLAALREVGLPEAWFERLPGGLSAGQRQRVNLARALVLEPELLILDETLSTLDATEQRQLLDLFDRLRRERGLTMIFISHDLAMLRGVCERIAVMYLGRMVEIGGNTPTYFEPLHPYTRALLAALPVLEPNPFAREACLLDGDMPSPIALPAGCSFASRCPQRLARCTTTDPPFIAAGDRGAACHLLAADEERRDG